MDECPGPVAASVPPWSEPVRGGYPDAAWLGLSGIEQLRASLAGYSPRPPIAHLFGNRLIEVGVGSAVFEMPLSEWLCGPHGTISIGALAIGPGGILYAADPQAATIFAIDLSKQKAGAPGTKDIESLVVGDIPPLVPTNLPAAKPDLGHAARSKLTQLHGAVSKCDWL